MIKENKISTQEFAKVRMDYCTNDAHRSHVRKRMHGPFTKYSLTEAALIEHAWSLFEDYLRRRKEKKVTGRKPRYFLSEIIYRCPKGTWLTDWERHRIVDEVLKAVGESCPSCHYWHEHDDGTWDCHLFISNCRAYPAETLRKSAYGNGYSNYWRVLHDAENRAIAVINAKRRQLGKAEFESVPEARARLAQGKGISQIHHELAGLGMEISQDNICEQLLRLGHSGVIREGRLTLTFKGTPHPRPYNLQKLVARANEHRLQLEHPHSDHLEPSRDSRITSMSR